MSAHNQHTANPDYQSGDNWVVCQVCGMDIYSSSIKRRWDGILVCPEDYERRHPQDFVRARKDRIAAAIVSPKASEVDVSANTRSAVAGVAIAGMSLVGYAVSSIPSGTFNTNTL